MICQHGKTEFEYCDACEHYFGLSAEARLQLGHLKYQTQRSIKPEQTQRRLGMLKLRLQGTLYKDIAQEYGVSLERVRQMICLPLWISKAIEAEGITELNQLEKYFHPDLSLARRMAGYEIAKQALEEIKKGGNYGRSEESESAGITGSSKSAA